MIKFETLSMPAASMGELNPMPDIKNVSYIHAGYHITDNVREDERTYIGKGMIPTLLPYKIQDGYDRNKKVRDFRAAVLENDYVKAVFLPELGGRLWSLYDKKLGRELLYVNPVYQPGNLGLRNAWFSGGVEFNVGIKGHNPLTCSPLWCAVDKHPEGDVLRLYEYERIRKVVYSISAYLPDDSPVLYLKCKIENTEDKEKYMYWWSNIAVPETKDTRVIVPADDSFLCFYNENHYELDKASIPVYKDIDVSYPSKISSSRDFFYKIPQNRHKWIASAEKDGIGLLQCSTRDLIGRKLFVWGQSRGGRNWNEWLSEEGSAYIEIQAGLSHVQLEHIPMKGKTTWEWVEAYTALQQKPETVHGDYEGAVSEIENYIYDRMGNPDNLKFPSDDTIIDTRIIYEGSCWGAAEEMLRGEKISSICKFPSVSDEETAMWIDLIEKNTFPCPDVSDEPASYVADKFFLDKLKALPMQSWYSLLHIGVIRYALGDVDGAKTAWEDSLSKEKSPWAYRNLAMLYKNELGDIAKGKELILQALELKKDYRVLLGEVAAILTSDNSDEMWLEIYDTLPQHLKETGRLRLYKAIALMNLNRLKEATEIINPDFVLCDIKEGELSVSQLWFTLYRRLYAEETGKEYTPDDIELITDADKKYPLPGKLDFRMHD